jgi:hypothetical protein
MKRVIAGDITFDENLELKSVVEEPGSGGCASALSDPERSRPENRDWFIRNMPSDLVEQVNAAAKAGRMRVGEWLTEKLRLILAQETSMLDDGARITVLEKAVEELARRVEALCAEPQGKARAHERSAAEVFLEERLKRSRGA